MLGSEYREEPGRADRSKPESGVVFQTAGCEYGLIAVFLALLQSIPDQLRANALPLPRTANADGTQCANWDVAEFRKRDRAEEHMADKCVMPCSHQRHIGTQSGLLTHLVNNSRLLLACAVGLTKYFDDECMDCLMVRSRLRSNCDVRWIHFWTHNKDYLPLCDTRNDDILQHERPMKGNPHLLVGLTRIVEAHGCAPWATSRSPLIWKT